jgi:[ribosomal protein S5]-alanine N-acetyltransferase
MESTPTIPLIATARLVLRPYSTGDFDALKNILHEPEILRYFPTQTPWPDDKIRNYISYQLNHWLDRGYGHWAVVWRETGQVIGWNGLEFLFDTNETEVGYLMSREFWGRGLATESARAAVDFGLNTIGLKQIIGLTHPDNIASQRVLEKCGLSFTQRATYFGMEMFRYAVQAQRSAKEAMTKNGG